MVVTVGETGCELTGATVPIPLMDTVVALVTFQDKSRTDRPEWWSDWR